MSAIRGAAFGVGLIIVFLTVAGGAALLGWLAGEAVHKYGLVYAGATVLILLLLIGALAGALLFGDV